MKDKVVLSAGSLVFKKVDNKNLWFIVKQNKEHDWEIPKTIVRRGESSVRASLRSLAEQGAMNAKILEEVGRTAGATKVNGKPVSQKSIFYLLMFKDAGPEVLGFEDSAWLEYSKAVKKLSIKKDQTLLTQARDLLKELEKTRDPKDFLQEEEEALPEEV